MKKIFFNVALILFTVIILTVNCKDEKVENNTLIMGDHYIKAIWYGVPSLSMNRLINCQGIALGELNFLIYQKDILNFSSNNKIFFINQLEMRDTLFTGEYVIEMDVLKINKDFVDSLYWYFTNSNISKLIDSTSNIVFNKCGKVDLINDIIGNENSKSIIEIEY